MKTILFGIVAGALVALAFMEAYRMGLVRFNYPSRDRYPVHGIDVSHHQGEIDWAAAKANQLSFAFIKITEGATHVDTRFQANWAGAAQAGLARGAYHFFTFCAPGAAQADHFLAHVEPLRPELPPAVDIEFSGNCKRWTSLDAVRQELEIFLAQVEARLHRQPLLYYTREAAKRILGDRFREHPRWPRSILGAPRAEASGPWSFWQYADNARLQGIRGPVDLDVFRGTRAEFDALSARRP